MCSTSSRVYVASKRRKTKQGRLERLTRQRARTAAIQGRQGSYEPIPLLEALVHGGVESVVIGATAAAVHGSP